MSKLAGLILFGGAFTEMVNTWNLWKCGALTAEVALEEIGRILRQTDSAAEALAKNIDTEEKGKPTR